MARYFILIRQTSGCYVRFGLKEGNEWNEVITDDLATKVWGRWRYKIGNKYPEVATRLFQVYSFPAKTPHAGIMLP
jgi:hypothetical protein